jgi:hypothetical protein
MHLILFLRSDKVTLPKEAKMIEGVHPIERGKYMATTSGMS